MTTRRMSDFLKQENAAFAGSGGRSQENTSLGFRPAFFDWATCTVYPSRFRTGALAPIHLLDGLPEEVVSERNADGRVLATKGSLIAGFERGGFFYTRTAAARAASEWLRPQVD